MQTRVSIHTLGCKVNQYDAAAIGRAFSSAGGRVVDSVSGADAIVVNTCTVTRSTDRQNRRLIRKLKRLRPDALMVVTGCQAEVNPWSLQQLDEVDLVVGNGQKGDLPRLVIKALHGKGGEEVSDRPSTDEWWQQGVEQLPGRTRAFIKVQDGCEGFCAYCIVPQARGVSRSRSLPTILREVGEMEAAGIQEIVLTGIRLGLYGRDQMPSLSLTDLLRRVLEDCSVQRIRLSSLEPMELSDSLIQLLGREDRICSHLHVPLQSGDDEVLGWMGRPYRSEQYRDRVGRANAEIVDLALGCDVIVGFPGETKEHFHRTLRFLEGMPFTYLHVFPFSPRRGTSADRMTDRVDPREIKLRSTQLRELSRIRKEQVMKSHINKTMPVLIEQPVAEKGGWMTGLTSNYLRVAVPGTDRLKNQIVPVKLESLENAHLVGRVFHTPSTG